MTAPPALAPLLESFFRQRLAKQRNATPATISCYRDALRLLILFVARRLHKKPAVLVLEDLDRDFVLAFLDELEETRKNSISTRNARLTAIRSFFHHVAANDPASFGVANRILTIPIKRAHVEVTHHLTGAEVDALIDAPDKGSRAAGVTGHFCFSLRAPAPGFLKLSARMPPIFSWFGRGPRCFYAARGGRNGWYPFRRI